jgi:putative oxidoreductase
VASLSDRIARTADRVGGFDELVRSFLGRVGIAALRLSVGIVFVWFGLLKVFDVSPVADLVARTVYWFDPDVVVPALGVFEMAVGALLIANRWLRLALALFAAQMLGTFLVFLILPDIAFRNGNPLLLTVEGEFVVKNLVLLAAGMVVGTRVRPLRARSLGRGDGLLSRRDSRVPPNAQ